VISPQLAATEFANGLSQPCRYDDDEDDDDADDDDYHEVNVDGEDVKVQM
jgi:hypothetical protein